MMNRRVEMNSSNSIVSILGLVLFFVLLFYVAKGFFYILGLITPALLIGAAILNWKVFPDYAKWVWNLLKRNPVMGVITAILSVIGLPVLSGFLFLKALFRYRMKKAGHMVEERRKAEFVDFEEVEDISTTPSLELPDMEKPKPRGNDYEGLFE